ncbi:MAG: two-component sensor histidine kinase [Gordonia sp.]|uniref:histidine kinase n=1 Tax=Gordonia rubripertincta TaxID=36822 RepID=A0ABT4MX00_GORRU|nr:histidine kinase [Gordonia rubripertincta]MBA4023250.1 two-component sensor histidine kinase [Gordonia sp. (in: high G+C Gram-positive bacteria)]MCZ4551507.1 histidine kinase [Gordonia rubripertincta]
MRWLTARYARAFALLGYQYPWYYMAIADVAIVATVLVATTQRILGGLHGVQWLYLTLAVVVAIAPHPACLFLKKRIVLTPLLVVATVISVAFFWLIPIDTDSATLLLVLAVTTGAAISTWKQTVFNMTLSYGTLLVGGATGVVQQGWMIAAMLCFGAALGHLLQAQLALLLRERQARAARLRLDRAAIASEVHDVVAHSLSIVLLNVTGARRALEEDGDIDDAVEALRDAETQGRAAMADIRQTIELLRTDAEPTGPPPGLDDLDDLVSSFRRAGQIIHHRNSTAGVPRTSATDLAAFRIVQESLTNASKHAPGAPVDLTVRADADGTLHIHVRNEIDPEAQLRSGGSGIDGMHSRAALLGGSFRSEPVADAWEVTAILPTSSENRLPAELTVTVVPDVG